MQLYSHAAPYRIHHDGDGDDDEQQRAVPVVDWTAADVAAWLRSHGFGVVAEASLRCSRYVVATYVVATYLVATS